MKERIVILIERLDLSTGNRYAVETRFDGSELPYHLGAALESAITEMRGQLDAKEKEVRNRKPKYVP